MISIGWVIAYVFSVIISIIFDFVSKVITKLDKDRYLTEVKEVLTYDDIGKYNVISLKYKLKKVISYLVKILIPFYNFCSTFEDFYGAISKDNVFFRRTINSRNYCFSLEKLIKMYEEQKTIEDTLRLEGLSEKEIKKLVKLGNVETGHKYITDKVYEDIKASKAALDFMNEADFPDYSNLSLKDRIKVLKQYKKGFMTDSKEDIKPIEKVLKIYNK